MFNFRWPRYSIFLLCILSWGALAEGGKVVYRIASAQGLKTALIDIEKDLATPGADGAKIKLVAQGPVVKHLSTFPMVGRPVHQVEMLQHRGVSFEVCSFSVVEHKISVKQLLPGVLHLDQGAPQRLVELEAQGYEVRER